MSTGDGIEFLELTTRLGAYAPVDAALQAAYSLEEDDDSPHGFPWHTSFHVSGLPPAGQECARKLVLGLMGLPVTERIEPEGRAIMDAGKDGERNAVRRLHKLGILITAQADEKYQTGLMLPDHWLTGAPDAVVVLAGWNRPHPIEFKGADNENEKRPKFKMLAAGEMEPEPGYVAQLQGYMNMLHALGEEFWPDLDLCETGSLVYFNRARPNQRLEFFYDRDPEWFAKVLDLLDRAKEAFKANVLPPHRSEGKGWTQDPCRWCPFKAKYCKPSWKAGYETLDGLAAMVKTDVDPEYDYAEKRMHVLARWAN